MKKKLQVAFYVLATFIMVVNQLGITSVVTAKTIDSSDEGETVVYHDYAEYEKALNEYNKEYAQYEKDLNEYNQKKQQHDEVQEAADRIEKENAQKKADYEAALAQYQKDLDEYNKKKSEVDEHSQKGQYIGPEYWQAMTNMEVYLLNFGAITQMMDTGLSLSGDDLVSTIRTKVVADPFLGNTENQAKIQEYIDQYNKFSDFITSIYGNSPGKLTFDAVKGGAMNSNSGFFNEYRGVDFFHTFSSNTGQTKDNIPSTLDHPTEQNIKDALSQLFIKTNGAPFDSATMSMDLNTFMVDQGMVDKWKQALDEAKKQSFNLFTQSLDKINAAYDVYNQSEYTTADYENLKKGINEAGSMQSQAFGLIGGTGVELEDEDNTAPFYNDLKSMSASDLANKYGYLLLLCNMASKTVYGFFHLQNPQANETIIAGTASSWANNHPSFSPSNGNYTPTLTEPEKPTPPMYEVVPVVPEEPVKPVPPVKPVYEPLNEITLLKIDKEDEQPLANAVFQLANKVTGEKLDTFTTASDGQLSIKNIAPGHYTLTEIQAPDGYILDSTPLDFVITGAENETVRLEKKNIPITGSVELTKLDGKTNQVLQGAVFEIRNSMGTVVRSDLQTNSKGSIMVDGLKVGSYEFIEVKAPTGYELDNTPVKFTIQKDQKETVKVSMKNQLMPGGVVLTKVDDQTGEVLQGAIFELKDDSEKVIKEGLTTDASGRIFVDGLVPGTYQLIETKAPTGYELDRTPLTVTIVKGQKEATHITMKNHLIPGGVTLTKKDAETGEVLQGAVFELQDATEKIVQAGLTTDATGKVAVVGLAPGTYRFIETKAPIGYDLDKTPIIFTIVKGQKEAVQLTMTNQLTPGGVVLTKIDDQTGEVLQGAAFELKNKKGEPIQSGMTTDATGKIAIDGLAPGTYQFVETKAPTGYQLDKTPLSFTISKDQKEVVQVTMTNKLEPGSVILTKKDNQTGKVLQGAVFELQDKNHTVIQAGLVTDVGGKIAVEGLNPGNYQFVETQAPAGYDLDKKPLSFSIQKGQKKAVQVIATNQLATGGVLLTKKDAKTGQTLQGAVFELRDQNGKTIKNEVATDETGRSYPY